MPDTSGSVDLRSLSKNEQAALEQLAQERGGPLPEEPAQDDTLLTAFIVLVDKQGNPSVARINDPNLHTLSDPVPDLVFQACHTLIKDITAAETAQATVQATMQQAQLMARQQQDAFLQAQIQKNPGGPRG